MNSNTEPGQPCISKSGHGFGPLPGTCRKCTSMSCSGTTLNCGKALSRASCAPSEARAPVVEQAAQILDIGAVGPGVAGCLIGQPRARQAFAQIGDGLVGDLRGEGFRLRVHSASSIAGLIGNLFSGDGW